MHVKDPKSKKKNYTFIKYLNQILQSTETNNIRPIFSFDFFSLDLKQNLPKKITCLKDEKKEKNNTFIEC